MKRIYKIGTRKSPLALRQVNEIISALKKSHPTLKTKVVGIDTLCDKDKNSPISRMEGSDFFTKEIDNSLLHGEIDFAVHSAKDLPDDIKEGLSIAAITHPVDRHDVLVSRSGLKLDELPHGAKIGTSSQRRKDALKKYRPDFRIIDIRGNVEERLALLDNDRIWNTLLRQGFGGQAEYPPTPRVRRTGGIRNIDAIVLAAAGLLRLGLGHKITQKIPFNILQPHALQGALAVVARTENLDLLSLLSVIDSKENILL